ncbi:MAG: MerR family transcriptional regulator [Alphaproteobacteria bacterium]|nr:MerR family transcriptional regulator [Alphaproteobacteria bacterium]
MSSTPSQIVKPVTTPQDQTQQKQTIQNIPNRRTLKDTVKKTAKKQAPAKSASAFRTISEVADELKVEQHVLRFWESKFSQIKPLKRGGGRRYYRPEDIELLKNIHHLLYQEGYTIKGVQKLLQSTRGNLSARVGDLVAEEQPEETASLAAVVAKNKGELQAMLNELKSLRQLIG